MIVTPEQCSSPSSFSASRATSRMSLMSPLIAICRLSCRYLSPLPIPPAQDRASHRSAAPSHPSAPAYSAQYAVDLVTGVLAQHQLLALAALLKRLNVLLQFMWEGHRPCPRS